MDNDIIWAAGFMDGEGTFTIKRVKYSRDKSKIYYQPYISCGQTIKGKKAIDRLQKLFGGNQYVYRQKTNRLDTITWSATSRDAQKCAERLLPYLLLKQEQAKLVIEFYRLMEIRKKNYRLADKDYDIRENLFQRIRTFNVKGKLQLKRLSEETPKGDATV